MLTTAPYIRIASALQGDGEACAPLLIKFICPTTTLFIYLFIENVTVQRTFAGTDQTT